MRNMDYDTFTLHLRGTPREVGFALGRAFATTLGRTLQRYIAGNHTDPTRLDRIKLQKGAMPWFRSIPARYQAEIVGLSEGAQLPLELLVESYFLDSCVPNLCAGIMCLLNEHAWVARNNDQWIPELWDYTIVREVEGRIPTISFTAEGDIFPNTGINREKLWLHYNYLPVRDPPRRDRAALDGFVFLTEALETCSTIEDVMILLRDVDRTEGMLLFVVEGSSERFALLECTRTQFHHRQPLANRIVGTNHYCTIADPEAHTVSFQESLQRYKRLVELTSVLCVNGIAEDTPRALIKILADDEIEQRGTGSEGLITVCANVACPGQGLIWRTCNGSPAASSGTWVQIKWPWAE